MDIKHEKIDNKGQFVAYIDNKEVGKMTYSVAGDDKIIIDHTEANPEYSGQGIGKHMLYAAVQFSRENGIKIIPLCPFAKKMMDRDVSLQDVLVK